MFKLGMFKNRKLEQLSENIKMYTDKGEDVPFTEGCVNLVRNYNVAQARGSKDMVISTIPPSSKCDEVYREITELLDWANINTFKIPASTLNFRDLKGFEDAGWHIKCSSKVHYQLLKKYDNALTLERIKNY